ncbi:MAG: hypothetical protein N3A66_02580 [Planctomycetota bacterium]|nr:hypothetical protein [Planctomycetota bacterium]
MAELRALWQAPALQRLLALAHIADKDLTADAMWRQCAFLALWLPEVFWQALADSQVADLHIFLLPPARPPWQGALLARATAENAARLATRLGISPGQGKVVYRYAQGWLCLASALEEEEPWLRGSAPSWTKGEKWREALEIFLNQPSSGIACWVDGAWLLEAIAYGCGIEGNLSQRWQTAGFPRPVALALRLQRDGQNSLWQLAAGDGSWPLAVSSDEQTAPAAAALFACLRLDSLQRLGARDGMNAAWQSFLKLIAIGQPQASAELNAQCDALCMLTGCHPRDLFTLIGPTLCLAVEEVAPRAVAWSAVCEVDPRAAARLARWLRRAMAWAAFLGEKKRAWTAAEEKAIHPSLWAGKISRPFAAVLRLYPRCLVIANDEKHAAIAETFLSAAQTFHRSALISWQARWSPTLRLRLAPALGEWGILSQYLEEESGWLVPTERALCLVSRGSSAPLSLIALAAAGGWAFTKEDEETQAIAWLRLILAAQQVYRHLGLGAYNGGGAGYAPDLALLADGRGENGSPLAAMYDRLYPPDRTAGDPGEENLSFSTIVRALARSQREGGGYFCGYRFLQPQRRGERPLDFSREWFLLAWPWRADSHPALLIDQAGRLYRRRAMPGEDANAALNLPENLAATGWQER